MSIAVIILITLGILVFVVEMPISFALGLTSFIWLLIKGIPITIVPQMMFQALDSFSLMAIPLFVLAGEIMGTGGITDRLIKFLNCLVGHVRGGLGLVNVLASMIFAGISGTATADTVAIGSILIPGMVKEGYDRDFSAAVTASSATIGIVIPPSVPMIVLGTLTGTSVASLFIGGLIPGIMIGLGLMIMVYIVSCKKGYPCRKRASISEIIQSAKEAVPALVMPLIILGGILGGVFGPTEAAAIAVVYAFFVGMYIYKDFKLGDFSAILKRSVNTTAAVMFIIASASSFAWLLASERIPQRVAYLLLSISGNNTLMVIMLINLIVIGLGTILDGISMLIIIIPVLLPVINQLNINLIYFCILLVLGVGIGQQTPPVGAALFVTSSLAKLSILDTFRANIRFTLVLIAILLLVTFFPSLATWLPELLAR